MFFFNGRIRNAHIVPMVTHDRSYTNKVGQSGIIAACLSVIIGLILIVIGTISETEKTTFFGVGIISLGVGFCLTTIVCFYTKLNICYHNWAYGPHSSTSCTAIMAQNVRTNTLSRVEPATMISNVGTKKFTISPSIGIGKTTINTHNVP